MALRRKISTPDQVRAFIERHKSTIRRYYITQDLSAKVIAEKMNVEFTPTFAKEIVKQIGPKGKGLGGSRPGSGNKKGIKFCSICRKKHGTCEHTKK